MPQAIVCTRFGLESLGAQASQSLGDGADLDCFPSVLRPSQFPKPQATATPNRGRPEHRLHSLPFIFTHLINLHHHHRRHHYRHSFSSSLLQPPRCCQPYPRPYSLVRVALANLRLPTRTPLTDPCTSTSNDSAVQASRPSHTQHTQDVAKLDSR